MIEKHLRKIISQLLLILCMLKKKKCLQLLFQKLKKQIILLIFTNKEKEGWHYLAGKILSASLHGITSKHKGDFYCLKCLHSFRTEKNLNLMGKYVKIKIFVEF